MRARMFTMCGVLLLCGLATLLVAQAHAHWLLWTVDDPELDRIWSNASGLVPFCLQLASYEAGAGRWSSLGFALPAIALGLMGLGFCGMKAWED